MKLVSALYRPAHPALTSHPSVSSLYSSRIVLAHTMLGTPPTSCIVRGTTYKDILYVHTLNRLLDSRSSQSKWIIS
jgi:hypothetical protein